MCRSHLLGTENRPMRAGMMPRRGRPAGVATFRGAHGTICPQRSPEVTWWPNVGDDGLIVSERDYFDTAALTMQLASEA